jgi:hypothetical protein
LKEEEHEEKQKVLSQLEEQEKEQEEPPQPPEPKELKEPRKRQYQVPSAASNLSLNEEDFHIVKEFVQTTRQQRKADKWAARKKEIVTEILGTLIHDSESEPEQVHVKKPTATLSLYDSDDFY